MERVPPQQNTGSLPLVIGLTALQFRALDRKVHY